MLSPHLSVYFVFSSGYRRTLYFRVPLSLLLPKQGHPFTHQRQGIMLTATLLLRMMVMMPFTQLTESGRTPVIRDNGQHFMLNLIQCLWGLPKAAAISSPSYRWASRGSVRFANELRGSDLRGGWVQVCLILGFPSSLA